MLELVLHPTKRTTFGPPGKARPPMFDGRARWGVESGDFAETKATGRVRWLILRQGSACKRSRFEPPVPACRAPATASGLPRPSQRRHPPGHPGQGPKPPGCAPGPWKALRPLGKHGDLSEQDLGEPGLRPFARAIRRPQPARTSLPGTGREPKGPLDLPGGPEGVAMAREPSAKSFCSA